MAIAGAGIAGLAAALALADAGVEVTLYERAPRPVEAGAGLQLSPNATAVLRRLGVLEALMASAVRPQAVRIRRGRDGADVVRMPLGEFAEHRYGAPFLVAHRADLHAALLAATPTRPGIRLVTGTSVSSYERAGAQVRLRTEGDDTGLATVDGLVGADGLRSGLRARRGLGAADAPVYCGRSAWRALLPAASAPAFARRPDSNLWLGPKAHLVHYPVRGGALINLVAIIEDRWRGEGDPDVWAVAGDGDTLRARYAGWAPEARALIEVATEWRVWPLFDRPSLAAWSDGAVTLVGDAAHPMLPFLAQGAAQAIEDAAALGAAVRRHPEDLASAFAAYGRDRQPRAARAQREARRQGIIYHLGAPADRLRDFGLRRLGPRRMLARFDWLYAGPSKPV